MDLSFSPEQEELAESVRRFSHERITPERLAAWERLPDGIDDDTWKQIAELGWLGIGLPTASGGSGLGFVDVAHFLSECARGLVPPAVASTVRAADALALIEPGAPELRKISSGKGRIALAIEEEDATEPEAFDCRLHGAHLSGSKCYVRHGNAAEFFIVAARDGDGLAWVLVDRDAVQLEPMRTFTSGDAQVGLRFESAPIRRRLCSAEQGAKLLAEVRRRQTALALAEMVGGMDALLQTTVAYVKEREQFGQKIAVFQAVQHQVADMATAYTASRHLAWQAITGVADEHDAPIDLPAAAAYVGTAFKQLAVTAHHLHGGAGFVVEHPLHYHSERAQSLCIRYTPEGRALAEVAAVLLD